VSTVPHLPRNAVAIPLPTPFAIGRVNAYLLDGDPLTLIDPGPHTEEGLRRLEAALAERGRRLEDVEQVLLTHQHHDHVGLAERVRERSGATIAAIEPLAEFMSDVGRSLDMDDRYAVATMLRHGVEEQVATTLKELTLAYRRFVASARVERRLSDGDSIAAGGREMTVIARPGHSPTDTVFHDPSDGLLIAGDHLLEEVSSNPVAHWPVGAGEPEPAALSPERRRPLLEYLASLRRTSELDVSLVLPGHGPPFADHRRVVESRERMHARRARKILSEVNGTATAADIGRSLWRSVPVTQAYLVLSEVIGHVDMLAAEGLVREREDGELVRLERSA
jgi:glyoxylase-like metal-dependent hydrolase (beta-lactamase superfamily II)